MQDPMYSFLCILHPYLFLLLCSVTTTLSSVHLFIHNPISPHSPSCEHISGLLYLNHTVLLVRSCFIFTVDESGIFFFFFFNPLTFLFPSFFVSVPLRLPWPVQYTELATRVNASHRKKPVTVSQLSDKTLFFCRWLLCLLSPSSSGQRFSPWQGNHVA